ncbi:VanW family protein [Desulfofarcimen acetoxidans DSM 771]|uniref:VanW family protein n=1 Tax=Desulfofarcimen acetoxidans (strain ATCC 49208 / DSM 771 / KCTC 5769 / VKM B-1644 / 5575) TaxID=485916 RepID=C8VZU9_DESAS|nr:VanW family protein [Desulfofarcimen acetoxidans]ACV63077.1 VanW family protein [Desulfofarcimen acetoxidans DSM 771]
MSKISVKIFGFVLIMFLILFYILFPDLFYPAFISQKVVQGVTIRGIDLSELSLQEGLNKLQSLEEKIRETKIFLKYEYQTYRLSIDNSGVRLDKQAIMNQALSAGHSGSLFRRWSEQYHIEKYGLEIPVKINIDKHFLEASLARITSDITIHPRNAAIHINERNEIEIIPSAAGLKADPAQACIKLIGALEADRSEEIIDLKMVSVAPEHTTDEIRAMGINTLLSAYKTEFESDNLSRSYNITVAAAALDGLLVPPGKTISFNEIVGPRSTEAGYKDAGVIVNNELVQGTGGGVCQVSTTLYNSVLLAGLEIVERTNHSLPVSYVPIGRDATVVYNSVDFKFRNNTNKHVYIKTITGNSSLTVKIFGSNKSKRDVELRTWITDTIEPQTVYKIDTALLEGQESVKQEGSKGYYAEGIRVIYNNGLMEATKPLPQSKYKPVNKVISVGSLKKDK